MSRSRCGFRFARHTDTKTYQPPFDWRAYCACGGWESQSGWVNTSRARTQARRAWRDIHRDPIRLRGGR